MATAFEKYQKRRLISSYFSVVISIGLVLFLLGLLGLLVLNSKRVADHFKEQVPIVIFLKDTAKEVEINQLKQSLELADYTRYANYVTKEEAAEAHMAEIGEDYVDYLGENPLQNNIDVRLRADYVTPEKVEEIITELKSKPFVDDVGYDKPLIEQLTKNVQRISFWVLVVAGIFLVIAILLINSSIRLSVYAKRFTIKTMQMVGATKRFIRRPFIWKSVRLGILGSILAMGGMAFILYYLNKTFPELGLTQDTVLIVSLFVFIFLMGLIITWISTFFATQRFLNLRTDELYY
ncbi:MAG: permease-like cell division protein FtsX [Bacteroidia bacterium]|nr:permease-like cell division protein FtsX [Bacteroidia bacterium]MBT8275684.1 permease-like cell division protein FtsX [Bacteroidia bacterium]NNF30415.1 FtsX-like permease family protein [Flavobacteriaceae bacterium]NNK54327.1 FtsX-like permease family protein [Flavobacteriaceae bacterium]NNM08818.1 FtsX-like permease family protein [Flavobacteriaceae bacterium]